MIQIGFGALPTNVSLRLGKPSTLALNMDLTRVQHGLASCTWDARITSRPRQLKLTTRRAALNTPRMSNDHGRDLYT